MSAPMGFGVGLAALRRLRGLSQNRLARMVGVDASYVNRLEAGARDLPSRGVVAALAGVLCSTGRQRAWLFWRAGYVPDAFDRLWPGDPTVMAVVDVLTREGLSEMRRADFRAVVETVAARWIADEVRQVLEDAGAA